METNEKLKRYKLLIDSPHIPKGTIVEFDSNMCVYVVVLGGIIRFTPQQIENRPEVWEEITEEEEQDVNKYLPFQPKEGKHYWYVDKICGMICECIADDSDGRHNVFSTKEAAEYEKLRQESMGKRWKPQTNEQYFYYIFRNSEADYNTWTNYETDLRRYFIGNVHKTKEEAEEWGKKYGEAWRVLL